MDKCMDIVNDVIDVITLNVMERMDEKYQNIIREFIGPCEVKYKLLEPEAKLPTRATDGSAGWDLYASRDVIVWEHDPTLIHTGIAIELPPGWEAQCRPRSGNAMRGLWTLFGTVDSDYRGELLVVALGFKKQGYKINTGDRIAQLVFNRVPNVYWVESELSDTDRGTGGFGSTGR